MRPRPKVCQRPKWLRALRAAVTSVLLLSLFLQVTGAQESAERASITIDAQKVENRISPLLYGQFLEFMYEGIKSGVHAELLRDRSFEEKPNIIGLPRYWERYPDDRNDDYALTFVHDANVSYPGPRKFQVETGEPRTVEHSLQVQARDGVITRRGFSQPRIPVVAGVEYRGYLWLKSDDFKGAVTVALESDINLGELYDAVDLPVNPGDWRKYEFKLRPRRGDQLARFAVLFPGRGRIWVDQVSLMPSDVMPGDVRRDVFDKIKALKPAFIRWPGGNVAQDYRWLWGIGPRDQRPIWTNLSWKNEPEPSDFGTDEFILLSRAVGAEPSITVNVEGRGATVNEAAAWVEYCNGPATSKYGAMRAANGHPKPFGVKFWEIGNEIWGDWVRGHSDAATYARNYLRYAKAMRAVDPSIKLIAVGDNNMEWNRTVLTAVGKEIDYLAIHHYYGRREMAGDPLNLMARPLFLERFYGQVKQMLDELAPGRNIKLSINEWGLDLPVERQYSMESALYAARLMNVFERSGNLVEQSAVSDLVNGWPGGIIQAGRHRLFVSPIYLVNELYNNQRGTERLAATVSGPTFDSTKEGGNVPYLDVAVSRDTHGKRIIIKAVNTHPTRDLSTIITLHGAAIGPMAQVNVITAPSLQVANDFLNPEAIGTRTSSLSTEKEFTVLLPKHSVTVIALPLNK